MNKIFSAVFGLLFFICASCHAYTNEGFLRVTMIDCGQGDSFLVETHEQNILIDTGDVDSKKLIAELNRAGVKRLEKVILTHPHADHIGGVLAVLNNFPVLKIFDNGINSNSPLFRKYRNADVPVSKLKAGDLIALGDGVTFHVFYPNQKIVDAVNFRGQKSDPNNESVVGRLTFGQFGMIFTGDISQAVEEKLLGKRLRATALKAPHHGSRTSSSPEFVASVHPQFIFISAGKDNRFGHPHKSVLAVYRQITAPENIFCTAYNGSVVIETDGVKTSVKPQKRCSWVEE